MDSYLNSYRTSPFSLAHGTPDSLSYSYRHSPYSTITKSMEITYSKSTGNLHSPTTVATEKVTSSRTSDAYSGSGFWPLRSPSRPVTIDGVRCHLKDVYMEQLSNLSQLWSGLVGGGRDTKSLSPSHYYSNDNLLIVDNEGRIVKDFSKEILHANTTTKRRLRVTGEFGSGKTTVLHNLLLNWCSDDSELSYEFPILLFVRSEYAFGRHGLEEVIQTLLPPAELKFVMRVLNDWNTRSQILFLVDDCEKYTQSPTVTWSRSTGYDSENGDGKSHPYPLDMNRLLKGLYLQETMVVMAGNKTQEKDTLQGKVINYTVYGLDEGLGEEFKAKNPLREMLRKIMDQKKKSIDFQDTSNRSIDFQSPIVDTKKKSIDFQSQSNRSSDFPDRNTRSIDFQDPNKRSIDLQDPLFSGVEKAVTELLARMSRPSHMSYEECIKILGLLSLISCQDYLPPLTFDSNHMLERKKQQFQTDEQFKEDADDVLRSAIDSGLLISPGTGVLITTTITDSFAPQRKRYDYVLAFPHQAFSLYLAARTFVSLNLYIDWTRIRQRRPSGNGHRDGLDRNLASNERYFLYFLTGIDPGYAQDLITGGMLRESGNDKAISLPWMVTETARKEGRPISAYADDHFVVIGEGEASDMIILNKLVLYYRSGQERALDFHSVLLSDAYDYDGTSIAFLRFRRCTIHDAFFRFSSSKLFDTLTGLEFHDCRFYDAGALEAFVLRLTSIAHRLMCLKIIKCQQLAESIELMRLISSKLFNLQTLQISTVKDNERSQKAAMALAEGLEMNKSIRRLILTGNEVADILFLVIINNLELEELDVSQCKFFNETRAWMRFVDDLNGNLEAPLKRSMITFRADENEALGDTRGLVNALESCNRLKLISMKTCFRSPVQAERFREAIKRRQNVNGLYRDVIT